MNNDGPFYPPEIEALIQKGEHGFKLSIDELWLILGAMDVALAHIEENQTKRAHARWNRRGPKTE